MEKVRTESAALGGCENKEKGAAELAKLLTTLPETAQALALGYARGLADAARTASPQKTA